VSAITFRVYGEPKGQPRPRAFARKMGDKFVARVFESGTAEGWKSLIASEAAAHVPDAPILGPVRVDAFFMFPRPRAHFRTGKHADQLRPDAPTWHIGKPDRDNLDKALLDALTQLGGFWRDDCQVCAGEIQKFYATRPGVLVKIVPVSVPAEVHHG
jgi:Holliday junction resolvase RusA-like endonuclease